MHKVPKLPLLISIYISSTLGVRCLGCLAFSIDLEDCWPGNDVFIRKIGLRFGQYDVDLARDSVWDSIDLVILVATGDSDLDRKLRETGEENGVDRVMGLDTEFFSRIGECARKGH